MIMEIIEVGRSQLQPKIDYNKANVGPIICRNKLVGLTYVMF